MLVFGCCHFGDLLSLLQHLFSSQPKISHVLNGARGKNQHICRGPKSTQFEKNYRKFCFIFQAMIQKKKSRLVEQLNEADILHQNTDRRASQVRQMLSKYSKDQSEFDTFLVDLIKHITDLKETEQRIQLGEEQLVALNDNLISLP